MRFLRQNTAVIVTCGPFYDKTDGVTIETALTITNERITLSADTDDGSAPTNILDNVTGATSGTSNDLNYITGNDAGMMQLELSAANTNRVGRVLLSITDAANHVPVFHEFFILPQAIYDWLTGVIVPLPANVTTIAGSAVSTSTAQLGVNVVNAAGTAWGSGAITAASIATGAIDADAIADNAIDAGAIATGAITAAKFAAGAIDAAAIANGAIDAATFAADVDAEAGAWIWNSATTGFGGAGTYGQLMEDYLNSSISAVKSDTAAILADTGTDGVVVAAASKTGYSLTATTGLGNQTANITGNLSGSVGSVTGAVGSVTGHTPQTGDTYALANGASGFVALKSDTAAILVDTGTDGVVLPQAQADKVWGTATRALTDKADFALSSASRDAIWDQASAITLSFETLLSRAYQMISNKMNVTDATGAVALRNIGDTGIIATGSVTDDSTTTTRAELSWV